MPPKRKRATASTSDAPNVKAESKAPIASNDGAQDDLEAISAPAKPAVNGDAQEEHAAGTETKSLKKSRSSLDRPSEHSDAEEDEPTSTRRKAELTVDPNSNHTKADASMDSPPRAGIVDPVGYHTNPPPEGRTVRVYADGVFDLFHLGHMRQLEQAKTAFPDTRLIVGVTGDSETHKRKGLTVLSGKERAETVRHCRWVDEVIEDCPWIVTAEFLAEHNLDYVAHDDLPYGAAEGDDIYKPIKEQGKFLVTQRTEGVSTTGIITKIVRDYEQYIARQLKRGTSRQELNVSWLKKNELDLKRHVTELRNTIRQNWSSTGQELGKELRTLWANSRPQSPAPSINSVVNRRAASSSEGQAYYNASNAGDKSPPPSAVSHLSHLEIPKSPLPPTSPVASVQGESADFARGYSLGLVGGVRSWMMRSRRNVLSASRPHSPHGPDSPTSSDDDGKEGDERGRKRARSGKRDSESGAGASTGEMEVETAI